MLIGAYRANEITEHHPLKESLKQFKESGGVIHEVEFETLQLEDVQNLLSRSLNCSLEESLPLAEVTMKPRQVAIHSSSMSSCGAFTTMAC